jgi:hypothetical protein
VRFTIPETFWEEWQADCRENFNDTYFLKLKFDHEFRKTFEKVAGLIMVDLTSLQDEVMSLKKEIADLQTKNGMQDGQEKKRKVMGFGAKITI